MKRKIMIVIVGSVILSLLACGDSLKNRLTKRLNNFRQSLPDEIREKFDAGQYEQAGKMLEERLGRIKSYVNKLPNDEIRRKFIRGKYEGIEKYLNGLSQQDLEFNKEFYPVIDYECIPTFNGHQIVDFFRVYFKEKLETL
ncbi:MAG: hypothetical protein JW827_04655 [Spirochaetes bacterium]|nr:hypothetical protein [Spirochaetota bacterium]